MGRCNPHAPRQGCRRFNRFRFDRSQGHPRRRTCYNIGVMYFRSCSSFSPSSSPSAIEVVAVTVFTVLSLVSAVSITSASPPQLEPVRRMEHRYRAAKTLQATFLERYTENGRTV